MNFKEFTSACDYFDISLFESTQVPYDLLDNISDPPLEFLKLQIFPSHNDILAVCVVAYYHILNVSHQSLLVGSVAMDTVQVFCVDREYVLRLVARKDFYEVLIGQGRIKGHESYEFLFSHFVTPIGRATITL